MFQEYQMILFLKSECDGCRSDAPSLIIPLRIFFFTSYLAAHKSSVKPTLA